MSRRHIGEGDRDGRVGQLQIEFEISFHAPGYASPTRGTRLRLMDDGGTIGRWPAIRYGCGTRPS